MLFPDEHPKHAREGPGASGMGRIDAAIARDHDPRLLVKGFDVAFNHGLADDVSFGIRLYRLRESARMYISTSERLAGFARSASVWPSYDLLGENSVIVRCDAPPMSSSALFHARRDSHIVCQG